ncbi:hypothetical protein NKK48_01560 [Mesorhizobium sp. C386A]|uniref:hypothetical protein n=1 Tax=unclassified Mesorhizobium TaxID=325217 RepID=UPI0003CECF97|nr:hypothetical protein [Mesorhizobium sp. LNJC386A00]ESY35767.1 hypothetical protein X748_14240 [Mesorhizobium sp. LNJC386A00]
MAGNAKTNKFMLSTATVMLGALADLHKLNPIEHSIGLVKNFQLTGEAAYTELTQGIRNAVVMSVRTGEGLKTSCEVYEFTGKNLAYAAGLDASGASYTVADDLSALGTEAAASDDELVLAVAPVAPVVAGDYLFVQKGQDDYVHIIKAASYDATSKTITVAAGFEVPTGMTFPVGARVGRLVRIDIGQNVTQPDLACKVTGILPKDNTPFTILLPKVKVTRGLGISFASDNFSNMPFEMQPYEMVTSDPFYGEYGQGQAILLAR